MREGFLVDVLLDGEEPIDGIFDTVFKRYVYQTFLISPVGRVPSRYDTGTHK